MFVRLSVCNVTIVVFTSVLLFVDENWGIFRIPVHGTHSSTHNPECLWLISGKLVDKWG